MAVDNTIKWFELFPACLVASILMAGLALSAGCDGSGNGPPPSGTGVKWEDRLEERRREYQANRERLLSDWRIAIEEVRRGELDAGKLYQQIVDLTRRLEEEQQRLEQWTVELHQWEETLLR